MHNHIHSAAYTTSSTISYDCGFVKIWTSLAKIDIVQLIFSETDMCFVYADKPLTLPRRETWTFWQPPCPCFVYVVCTQSHSINSSFFFNLVTIYESSFFNSKNVYFHALPQLLNVRGHFFLASALCKCIFKKTQESRYWYFSPQINFFGMCRWNTGNTLLLALCL